jgi:hypothetical protein
MLSKVLNYAFVSMLSLGHDSFDSFEVTKRCNHGATPATIATLVAGSWSSHNRPRPGASVDKKAPSVRRQLLL